MKYIKGFFTKKEDKILTEEDIEDIEDVFLTYIDGCKKNRFKFKKIDLPLSANNTDVRNIISKNDDVLNYYYFRRKWYSQTKLLPWSVENLIIFIWTPSQEKMNEIAEKLKIRLLKFGLKVKFINGNKEDADLAVQHVKKYTSHLSNISGKNRMLEGEYILREFKIIISKI